MQEGFKDSIEHSPVLNQVVVSSGKPVLVVQELELDGCSLMMKFDTGAAVSLVSEKMYRLLFPDNPMQVSTASLKNYSGEPLRVVGQREVEVHAKG